MKCKATVGITIAIMALISVASIQGQTIEEISKAATQVPFRDKDAVAEYVKKYGKEVVALAGYGKMPWGISLLAVNRLSGMEPDSIEVSDISEMLQAIETLSESGELTQEKRKALMNHRASIINFWAAIGRLTAVSFAPHAVVSIGSKGDKGYEFYFVDNQFMGLLMRYKKAPDWKLLLRALVEKYGKPEPIRKKHESSLAHEYLVYQWENDAGMARLILFGTGELVRKLQEETIEQMKRDMEIEKTKARFQGVTETEIELEDQIADGMMQMLEQQMQQQHGDLELVGISYASKQLQQYAQDKLEQQARASAEEEQRNKLQEEKQKDKVVQELMDDV